MTQDIQLGGIRTFPGLRPGELRGERYWFAGTSYQWRLFDTKSLFRNALYGIRLQAGRMAQRIDVDRSDTLVGLAGSLSGRTAVGPFILSLGFVDNNGSWLAQFTLGRPVSEGSLLDDLH